MDESDTSARSASRTYGEPDISPNSPSLEGASYFVSFIDDSTRKVWAYPIRTKDRVFSIFSDWLAMVENQSGRKLKCLRTDNGGEFKFEEFFKFCRERDIRQKYTTPYSPKFGRCVQRVGYAQNSRTESTDSAQPNASALDHLTLTPGATSPVIR